MQKWLNDLYAQILKNGFNPGGGGGGGGSHSGGSQGVLVGNYLGDTYTDTQKQAIANGTFEGLNIGDYWTINGVNYRIADFDYYYNVGDENNAFTKHHVIIVPDTTLYQYMMDVEVSITGCYSGSGMFTDGLKDARNAFYNAFGASYIPTHKGLYANALNNGVPSGWAWRDMRIELMNEEQVLGHAVWGQNGYDVGTQKTQFRLFSLDPTKINIRERYWLTNVKSSDEYAYIDEYGGSNFKTQNRSYGVRPFACLVGD
jgi:hypothetical protein